MPKNESYKDLVKRLDAIINILLETFHPEGKEMPNIKKIEILHRVGLRPTEISKILGISEIYVNVGLTRIRKRKARRK
jgi:hypothetical protein